MHCLKDAKRLGIHRLLKSLPSAMVIGLALGTVPVSAQVLPHPVPLNEPSPSAIGNSVLSGMSLGEMVESGPPMSPADTPMVIREPALPIIHEPSAGSVTSSNMAYQANPTHAFDGSVAQGSPCIHGAYPASACSSCSPAPSGPRPALIARPAHHCGQCRLPANQCCCQTNKRQVHHVFLDAPPPSSPSKFEPATASDPSAASIPEGAFVAPPQQGSIVGASRSLGMRGMRITLPQLAFEMPSIELPSILRRSRSPRMEIDADQAAYVVGANEPQAAPAQAAFQMPMYGAPAMAAPAMAAYAMQSRSAAPAVSNSSPSTSAASTSQPDAPSTLQRSEQEFDALEQRCCRLESLLQQMIQERQSLPPQVFAAPACQEAAPPCPPSRIPHVQAPAQSSCD